MGKGKDHNNDRSEHVSQPLSSLKDPSSFGPPPKHVKYHGAAALPNETTPDRSGLGAPLPQEQISHQNAREQQRQEEWEAQQAEEEAEAQRSMPAGPYRVNTTGLRTDHLPPPPKRVDSPVSSGSSNSRPKPSLPPRLPPRNSTPVSQEPAPPPAYSPVPSAEEGYMNQGATSRLANAGVSVPALGIGDNGNGSKGSPRDTTTSSPAGQAPANELQSRFAQMRTPSNVRPAPSPSQSGPPAQYHRNDPPPTSGGIKSSVNNFREQHADKIDAGKQKMSGLTQRFNNPSQSSPTTQNDHNDPPPSSGGIKSSVNNFRDQHADKIDAGKQKMSGFSTRFNNYVDGQKSLPSREQAPPPPAPPSRVQPSASSPSTLSSSNVDMGVSRKKPPPPPPKRADMRASNSSSSAPPPLPLNTKPR